MNETIADALTIAIGAEKATERLFLGLEAKFASYEDVALFWHQYALDETKHAEWLEKLRARLTPAQLAEPVEMHAVELMQSIQRFSVDRALERVKNLEDAYQLVAEVENGETNAIFQFLLNYIETDQNLRNFVQNQLNKHIARLAIEFPIQYKGATARRAIRAI